MNSKWKGRPSWEDRKLVRDVKIGICVNLYEKEQIMALIKRDGSVKNLSHWCRNALTEKIERDSAFHPVGSMNVDE